MCLRREEDHYSSGVRSLLDAVSWGDIDVCFGVGIRTVECTEIAPRIQRREVAFVKRIRHLTSYSLRNSPYLTDKVVFENSVLRGILEC